MAANRQTPTPSTHPSGIASGDYAVDVADEVAALWGRAPAALAGVSGTNDLTAAVTPTLAAYAAGQSFWLLPVAVNSGPMTLNIDSLGVRDLVSASGAALASGALAIGELRLVQYDGARFRLVNQGQVAVALTRPPDCIFEDRKSSGTAGGTSVIGSWQARALNTSVVNTLAGASLDTGTGQITLPAGDYWIVAAAPAYGCGYNRVRLYNVTDGAAVANSYGQTDYTGAATLSTARLGVKLSLSASKAFRVEQRVSIAVATYGLGAPAAFGVDEIYTRVEIYRVGDIPGDTLEERIRDTMGLALAAGNGVAVTVSDAADSITLALSGSYTGAWFASGNLGAGVTPTVRLDARHDQDAATVGRITNAASGAAAQARFDLYGPGASYASLTLADNSAVPYLAWYAGASVNYFSLNFPWYLFRSTAGTARLEIDTSGHTKPGTDNAYTLGASGRRWSAVWAATGTIQTSDAREKTDIADLAAGLDFIRALRPVSYRWRVGGVDVAEVPDGETHHAGPDGDIATPKFRTVETPRPGARTHWGLLAQDVQAVLAAQDLGDCAGVVLADPTNPQSQMGLRYEQMIPPLIAAVQQLATRLDALENQE